MRRFVTRSLYRALVILLATRPAAQANDADDLFRKQIAPLLEARCLSCHNDPLRQGGLSLETRAAAMKGGESGEVIVPGNPDGSYLLDLITASKGVAEMPKDAAPLKAEQVAAFRKWIERGAKWPADLKLEAPAVSDRDWWSLKPIEKPPLPTLTPRESTWTNTPIDAFIAAKHREKNLSPAPPADRRTLIRRLSYDLTGLPPALEEIDAFLNDPAPDAYERLLERLLASPHYGEHWARHWLDVSHYADTHGYDKDKPRPNAWPYRDYVIRSFNADKPYARFVREQIAGDVLWPRTLDGVAGTGFLAAGPWDFIGHVEVPESKIDGKVARHLDRDDFVTTAMNTFCSLTVQCARCHHHKFDPIRMEDYYRLQSVFAAIDRADRALPLQAGELQRKQELLAEKTSVQEKLTNLRAEIQRRAGPRLKTLEERLGKLSQGKPLPARPEFGFHSQISPTQHSEKWVQIDLGKPEAFESIVLVGCHDDFNNIGAGFGFPPRYKIEASNDSKFEAGVRMIVDHTKSDAENRGTTPQCFAAKRVPAARYVRVTATKLAPRKNDFIFALGEVVIFDNNGRNLALGKSVTSLDFVEAPVRWSRNNLTDGRFFGQRKDHRLHELARLQIDKQEILDQVIDKAFRERITASEQRLRDVETAIRNLPPPKMVYATATQFPPQGQFSPTKGKPRRISLLVRGDVTKPSEEMQPGTVRVIPEADGVFDLPSDHSEGERRRALADWLTRPDNPLTWRSIVNRVWLYHFGRGLVDSPNDFGRGGQLPSHPELSDWLAADFRDHGGSLKRLHRMICLSATYRQASIAKSNYDDRDANNIYLWRMNRRRLTAEELRDSVLHAAGRLRNEMGGPGFQDFLIEKPQHSPHYEYDKADPSDPKVHRRAIYRFIVRSQPQPMLTVLDCADPARSVPKRDETLTPLQSLSLMNNPFMVEMAKQFARRLQSEHNEPEQQFCLAYRLLLGRLPSENELAELIAFAQEHGLPASCRLLLNLNEFLFVD